MIIELSELELRRRYNLTVLTIRRSEQTIGSPSAGERLQPGDRLVVIGEAGNFARSTELFRV